MTDVYKLTVTELDSTIDVDTDATVIDATTPPDVYRILVDDGCVSLQVVADDAAQIHVVEETTDLTFEEIVTTIELVGEIGPPGPAGSSSQITFKRNAGTVLSGHRIVTTRDDGTAVYADSATLADATKPKWLTLDAALEGEDVTVLSYGDVTEGSWNWTPGVPIFLGQNGTLTQTPPAHGNGDVFIAQVASPNTPTDVFYDPSSVIILSS